MATDTADLPSQTEDTPILIPEAMLARIKPAYRDAIGRAKAVIVKVEETSGGFTLFLADQEQRLIRKINISNKSDELLTVREAALGVVADAERRAKNEFKRQSEKKLREPKIYSRASDTEIARVDPVFVTRIEEAGLIIIEVIPNEGNIAVRIADPGGQGETTACLWSGADARLDEAIVNVKIQMNAANKKARTSDIPERLRKWAKWLGVQFKGGQREVVGSKKARIVVDIQGIERPYISLGFEYNAGDIDKSTLRRFIGVAKQVAAASREQAQVNKVRAYVPFRKSDIDPQFFEVARIHDVTIEELARTEHGAGKAILRDAGASFTDGQEVLTTDGSQQGTFVFYNLPDDLVRFEDVTLKLHERAIAAKRDSLALARRNPTFGKQDGAQEKTSPAAADHETLPIAVHDRSDGVVLLVVSFPFKSGNAAEAHEFLRLARSGIQATRGRIKERKRAAKPNQTKTTPALSAVVAPGGPDLPPIVQGIPREFYVAAQEIGVSLHGHREQKPNGVPHKITLIEKPVTIVRDGRTFGFPGGTRQKTFTFHRERTQEELDEFKEVAHKMIEDVRRSCTETADWAIRRKQTIPQEIKQMGSQGVHPQAGRPTGKAYKPKAKEAHS